jgi:hypothetical protein
MFATHGLELLPRFHEARAHEPNGMKPVGHDLRVGKPLDDRGVGLRKIHQHDFGVRFARKLRWTEMMTCAKAILANPMWSARAT